MKLLPQVPCILLSLASLLCAKDLRDPILRVNLDGHTATISRLATDASGRLVLTCSKDKTARLWSLAQSEGGQWTSALLRTLHPPMSEGEEGMLYSCALTKDGKLAAIAGITGQAFDGNTGIYLYDTATGSMVRRIAEFPLEQPLDLAFSPSGATLAVNTRSFGVRVFDTGSGNETGRDEKGGDVGLSADWLDEERFVTTSYDGTLRLYRIKLPPRLGDDRPIVFLKPETILTTGPGKEPSSAIFSPDGTQLAVGFADAPALSVYDAKSLKLQFSLSADGIPNAGEMNAVTWLDGGRSIAACINCTGGKPSVIRVWPEGGKGKPRDVTVPSAVIYDLQPLPSGALLFCAEPSTWGVVGATPQGVELKAQFMGASPIADFRNQRSALRISEDASVVSFSYTPDGSAPAVFSVKDGRLTVGPVPPAIAATLHGPRHDGIAVSQWQDSTDPMVKDYKLNLIGKPMIHSLAVAADASFFIFGTHDGISGHYPSGRPQWWVNPGAAATSVNLSEDGRIAVAAYTDGTIRWHDIQHEGNEILVLLPHADRQRWVVWAPASGFMDTNIVDRDAFYRDLDTAAKAASLETGVDLVDTIDGVEEDDLRSAFARALARHKPGEFMTLTFVRKGVQKGGVKVLLRSKQKEVAESGTYFDCSPGADDLIAWHINQAVDRTPRFLPGARFRAVFYRPDVVRRVLQHVNVNAALVAANTALGKPTSNDALSQIMERITPPEVYLLSGDMFGQITVPADAQSVKLRYSAGSAGGGRATKMQVRLNGRPLDVKLKVPAEPTVKLSSITEGDRIFNRSPRLNFDIVEATVPLPDGAEGTLALIAGHDRAMSEAALVQVQRSAPPVNTRKPALHLIAAGVSKLQANIGLDTDGDGAISDAEFLKKFSNDSLILDDLNGADADARRVGELFLSEEGRTFGKVTTKVLTNEQATTAALRAAIKDVAAQTRTGDVFIFSFAGHGYADEKHEFFLATHDVNPDKPVQTALTGNELATLLDPIKARVVLLLDTCQAGAVLGKREGGKVITGPADLTGLVNTLSSAERGIVVLSSSSESELSFESDGGGYFTRALSEGLQGEASRDGAVTCVSLQDYITKRVPELLKENSAIKAQGLTQTPTVIMPKGSPDFILARP